MESAAAAHRRGLGEEHGEFLYNVVVELSIEPPHFDRAHEELYESGANEGLQVGASGCQVGEHVVADLQAQLGWGGEEEAGRVRGGSGADQGMKLG